MRFSARSLGSRSWPGESSGAVPFMGWVSRVPSGRSWKNSSGETLAIPGSARKTV